jgi:hypothetical protein
LISKAGFEMFFLLSMAMHCKWFGSMCWLYVGVMLPTPQSILQILQILQCTSGHETMRRREQGSGCLLSWFPDLTI